MIHDSEAKADNSHYGLRLGAYGWQHPEWQNTFYPDDLPKDWFLDFYSNEFTTVVVPAQYWSQGYEVKQWCQDVSSRFRFYLEYPAAVESRVFADQCASFGSLLGGVIGYDITVNDLACPTYQITKKLSTPQLLHALDGGSPDIALVEIGDTDLRQQRSWLENFDLKSKQLATVLVYDKNLAIDKLQSFKTLIELMSL